MLDEITASPYIDSFVEKIEYKKGAKAPFWKRNWCTNDQVKAWLYPVARREKASITSRL